MAFYTECTVTNDTELAIRPGGHSEPRYAPIEKGDKVAFRNSYQNCWFVLHYVGNEGGHDYGWVPQSVLTDCQKMDGTP
jgi:hypothetical protein